MKIELDINDVSDLKNILCQTASLSWASKGLRRDADRLFKEITKQINEQDQQ